jgi:hypothetical protein
MEAAATAESADLIKTVSSSSPTTDVSKLRRKTFRLSLMLGNKVRGRHGTQHNDIQYKNKLNDVLSVFNGSVVMLSVASKPTILSVIMMMLNVVMLSVIMLNVFMLSVFMLSVFMLSAIMLNVFLLIAIMLSVGMLSAVAPVRAYPSGATFLLNSKGVFTLWR